MGIALVKRLGTITHKLSVRPRIDLKTVHTEAALEACAGQKPAMEPNLQGASFYSRRQKAEAWYLRFPRYLKGR
jgi:hypothetical protein